MTATERFHEIISGRRRGPVAALARAGLWVASIGYGVGITYRNRRLDRRGGTIASVPVVSVGNLTLGGTGKTPCVEYLARFFRERDVRVAILSRGYGAVHGPNDEALLLEENLPDVPHLQGADRVALSTIAVDELEAELLILDDGFQHRRLHRNLDVVLIDATNPWGNGYLFPRGLLREPQRSLHRAGAVVLTKAGSVDARMLAGLRDQVKRWVRPEVPVAAADHQPIAWRNESAGEQPPQSFAGRPAAAFCGLGNPESFRTTLSSLGVRLIEWRTYADHHPYSRADVAELERWAGQLPSDAAVLTTQKDSVKLRVAQLAGRPLWSLRIAMSLHDGPEAERFHNLLCQFAPMS